MRTYGMIQQWHSIDKVIRKYEQSGVKVSITGLNERSSKLVANLATIIKELLVKSLLLGGFII